MADNQQNNETNNQNNNQNNENNEENNNSASFYSKIDFNNSTLLASVWGITGMIAFILSLVCFGYSGTIGEKILGFIISIIFGPLYFFYYYFSQSYCKSNSVGGKRRRK